ncbi:ATP binding [Massospora cicadina]|nr:ATP binding [Massospora cicadina]
MSFGMVKQNCVRVFGSDGQTRIVNDDELHEPTRKRKVHLAQKHLPVNHSEFKKFHAQRLATARGSPRQENQAPGANSKHDKLTKIFGARPPSELITSNLHRFFPVSEEKETESESELLEPLAPDSTQAPRLAAQQDSRPRIRTPAWNDSSLLSPSAQTSPLDNQPDIILGKRANGPIQWQQGEFIGAGSHGEVYLGLNSRSAELLAIKRVPLSRILPFDQFNPHGTQQNEVLKLDALHREVELLRTLEHPNIVRYIDSQVVQSDLVILMEYVPGGSIAALLSTFGPLEETLIRSFVRQILCGLAFLHGRGIIHRDIKGANILVDNKGQAKISDFGLSKQLNDDTAFGTNHRSSFQGSVYWMAPEVVKLSLYTYKADIWGLGCLIVEMLTGIHPFPLFNQVQAIFQAKIPDAISSDCHNFLEWTFKM